MGFSAWLDTRANVDAFVWRPVQLATAMDSNLIFDDLWKYGNEACGGNELSDQRQGRLLIRGSWAHHCLLEIYLIHQVMRAIRTRDLYTKRRREEDQSDGRLGGKGTDSDTSR
jgi:hypothetical protein